MIRFFSRLIFILLLGGVATAQDELPAPSFLADGSEGDGIQFAHGFSLRLKPDYCYHSFTLAYDQEHELTDLRLRLHFGSGGTRLDEAELRFARLGGTFVDRRHLTFSYNTSCRVDEVRVIEMSAMKDGELLSLAGGLTVTTPRIQKLATTQGLPIPEGGAGNFRGVNLEGEGQVKCLANGANLRSGPSTNTDVLTTIQATGTNRVPVTIVSEVAGGEWFQVETPAGPGYLFGRLLGPC